MLVVTIELWPSGRIADKREVARLEIANISNLSPTSSYDCVLLSALPTRRLRVTRHRRADGALALTEKVLAAFRRQATRAATRD